MPQDLCRYDEAKKPGLYLVVRVGTGHYFLEDNPQRAKVAFYGELKNPKAKTWPNLGKIIDPEKMILDVPLVVNKMWGAKDSSQYLRRDRSYCWIVDSQTPTARGTTYRLFYLSRPDHTLIDFVPGVGIVYFEYVHRGTVSQCFLHLVKLGKQ